MAVLCTCNAQNTVFGSKCSAISNTWFLGPTQVLNANGSSIASAVFAELSSVTDRQTDKPERDCGLLCLLVNMNMVTTVGIMYYSARSYASAENWIHFKARFAGIHAFGYISADRESTWMKYGAL